MCGIVGMSFRDQYASFRTGGTKRLQASFTAMLEAAQSRGSAATGCVIVTRPETGGRPQAYMYKAPLPAKEFTKTPGYVNILDKFSKNTLSIIGHTRAVSDDIAASARNNNNNHPFYTGGRVVGVHNGKIFNYEKLWERFAKSSEPFKRKGNCDSEVIFTLIADKLKFPLAGRTSEESISSALEDLFGWYAVAFVDLNDPGKVFIAKDGENPMSLAYDSADAISYFASEARYIDKATIHTENKSGRQLSWYDFPTWTVLTLDSMSTAPSEQLLVKRKTINPKQNASERMNMMLKHGTEYKVTQGI